MTPAGWAQAVAFWRGVWPDRALPAASVETWYDLLADLDDAEVVAALVGWANDPDRSWPPQSPGEIRAQIGDTGRDWTEAIGVLATLVRRNGRYAPRPEITDPAIGTFVDSVGGWTRLCDTFDPSDTTTRAQFRDHFQTVQKRTRKERAMELGRGLLPELGGGTDDG